MDEDNKIEKTDEEKKDDDKEEFRIALLQLALGITLFIFFSFGFIDTIRTFSKRIDINMFYVAFIIIPLCINGDDIYSVLKNASKKSSESITFALTILSGTVCVNNTFVLLIFCIVLLIQKFEWTYLVETLAVIITVNIVGLNSIRSTIYTWHGFVVVSLFPLSLIFIACLNSPLSDNNVC